MAVLVTNDSDLVEPVKIVRQELGLPVGILNPSPNKPSHELRKYASFVRQIRKGVLAVSLFPSMLKDLAGTSHKPPTW